MELLQFAAEGEGSTIGLWIPMVAILVLWFLLLVRGKRRDQSAHDKMLNSLKKNDRVVTIGGIIGTVASTSQDGKEVTLKIDDNARLRVLRSAIQGPLRDQDQKSDGDKSGKDRVAEEASKS